MNRLFRNRPLILSLAGLAMAAIGAAGAIAASMALDSTVVAADRIALVYGPTGSQTLPHDLSDAVAAGWEGTIRCHAYQGRYLHRPPSDVAYPLSLVFDHNERLTGIYLYTEQEQPSPPWLRQPRGVPFEPNLGHPHWGLGIYVANPATVCGFPIVRPR